MHLAMVASRRPVCIDREATIADASTVMREQKVDDLLVTETVGGTTCLSGIVSARDIVTRVVAMNLDPSILTVGDLVWSRPMTAHLSDGVSQTLERLCATSADLLPVVDSTGRATGLVSMDDLLQALAGGDTRKLR